MVQTHLKDGRRVTIKSPADLWELIREELGDAIADLVEGTVILSGEELEDWWSGGCQLD